MPPLQLAPKGATRLPRRMSSCARKFFHIRDRAVCSRGSPLKAQPFGPITARTRSFTADGERDFARRQGGTSRGRQRARRGTHEGITEEPVRSQVARIGVWG